MSTFSKGVARHSHTGLGLKHSHHHERDVVVLPSVCREHSTANRTRSTKPRQIISGAPLRNAVDSTLLAKFFTGRVPRLADSVSGHDHRVACRQRYRPLLILRGTKSADHESAFGQTHHLADGGAQQDRRVMTGIYVGERAGRGSKMPQKRVTKRSTGEAS